MVRLDPGDAGAAGAMSVAIPLAKFTPDQAPLSGQASIVENVYPKTVTAYGPIGSLTGVGNALDARCQGAWSYRGSGGTVGTFAGNETKLYLWDGTAFNDVSQVGGYTTADEDMWDSAQYGDLVIAVNGVDPPQSYVLGTGPLFADLAGSPPTARFAEPVGDFVFLGRLDSDQSAVQWCEINDPESWGIGVNQGDIQPIPTGGRVMGIIGGPYAIVFMETAIHRFIYTGNANIVFQREEISLDRGCIAEGSLARYQDKIFFLSSDGFYLLQGGANPVPIGGQKIDNYFRNSLISQAYLYRMSSTVDPIRKLYVVSFTSVNSLNGLNDMIFWYNWETGDWSYSNQYADIMASLLTNVGYTGDNFPTATGDTSPDDPGVLSPDSSLLVGSPVGKLGAFGPDFKMSFFEGPNLEAQVQTVEGEPTPGRKTMLTRPIPRVDGGSPSIKIGYRNRLNDAVTWTALSAQNAVGFCPVRVNAKLVQGILYMPSGAEWNFMEGIDIAPGGTLGTSIR